MGVSVIYSEDQKAGLGICNKQAKDGGMSVCCVSSVSLCVYVPNSCSLSREWLMVSYLALEGFVSARCVLCTGFV